MLHRKVLFASTRCPPSPLFHGLKWEETVLDTNRALASNIGHKYSAHQILDTNSQRVKYWTQNEPALEILDTNSQRVE